MKLASSQIDCAGNSYVALFFLCLFSFVLSSDLVMSLPVLVSVLSVLHLASYVSSHPSYKVIVNYGNSKQNQN